MKPSEPLIWHTLAPPFISLHAVLMAAAIESHFTGIGASMQKIVYVMTLGNLALGMHERSNSLLADMTLLSPGYDAGLSAIGEVEPTPGPNGPM
jgi:hypothetical protein